MCMKYDRARACVDERAKWREGFYLVFSLKSEDLWIE